MKKQIVQVIGIIFIYFILSVFSIASFNIPNSGFEIENNTPQLSNKQSDNLEAMVIESSPDIDLNTYRQKYNNQDIIARLEIPNLFNILITQTSNNDYYLNHSLSKEKDNKGTEFMDYRNTIHSKQINIYGHNSRTYDLPFRKLENFLNKDFFNQNKYIILQTEKERRIYEISAIKEVNKDTEHMNINYHGSKFVSHVSELLNNAINKRNLDYDEDSNILILQTCSYDQDDSYYIIVAIEIE